MIHDVDSGVFFDPERLHTLNHEGQYYSVKGPLNVARPVHGWPVIAQAGASDAGRQLASETAEMIFTVANSPEQGRAFRDDVRGRAAAAGRDPNYLKVMPGVLVVVADSKEEAEERRRHLDSLVNMDSAMGALSIALGHDASQFDLDGPLPEIPESNQSQSGRARAIDLAKRHNLTVRQLAQRLSGFGGFSITGTAADIADEMQLWLESGSCDGFMIMFPYLPAGLDDFVNKVVPELQRRGHLSQSLYGQNTARSSGIAETHQSVLRLTDARGVLLPAPYDSR